MPERQRLLKFAEYLTSCSKEVYNFSLKLFPSNYFFKTFKAAAYGQCVAVKAEKVGKDDCKAEFERLIGCFKKNVRQNTVMTVLNSFTNCKL